ncbi:MAG: 50S ribosomal protein L23, partial [Oscillospiraceae bacterium]|nr:50S ribosomal protein L23 [Oscillospiraceae bacterium]
MKSAYDVILRPIISEQSMEALDLMKYVFEVSRDANKIEIRNAVEEIFGVQVAKVTTLNMQGKAKQQGRYPKGTTRAWKKAVVRLKPESK